MKCTRKKIWIWTEMLKFHLYESMDLLTKRTAAEVSKLKVVNANWIRFPIGTMMVAEHP